MTRRIPRLALSGAVLVATAPAAASAATITPTNACYTHVPTKGSEPATLAVTGGAPGGRFQVYGVGGKAGSAVGTFDGAGNALTAIPDVSPGGTISPSKGRTIPLAVQEFGPNGPRITGTTTIKVTNLAVDVARRPRSPLAHRVVRVSGTAFAGKTLYGLVTHGSKSRHVIKRFRIGRANACGYVRAERVVARSRHRGHYTLYVQAGKHLSKSRALAYRFRVSRY